MKLIYMFLVALGLIMSVGAETIPDSISQGGVTIDFTRDDPLDIQKGVSIQEVAEVASDWFERYLKPNLEIKNVSAKDLYLLAFCLETFDVQVEGLRRFAENSMGLSENKDGKFDFPASELKIRDLNLRENKICIRKSLRETLKACPYEASSELKSYCARYNYRNNGWAFSDDKTISGVLRQARENNQEGEDSIEVLSLDPSRYGKYKELKSTLDLARTKMAFSLGGIVVGGGAAVTGSCLAWLAASGTGAAASGTAVTAGTILGFTPVVGWGLLAAGGVIGSGVCAYKYFNKDGYQDGYLKARKVATEDIHRYVRSLDKRFAYRHVLASDSGPYQKSYMELVRIQQFIINWEQSGWLGWEGLTDLDKDELDEWAERIRVRSCNALTELEDRLVNYPLMGNILEAQSACLYVNYLRVKDYDMVLKKETELNEYKKLRDYWLENSQKVGELCSELSRYSTTPLLLGEIGQYNLYLQFTYATNYNTTIETQVKKDEHIAPVFAAREQYQVEAGCIKPKMSNEYDQVWSAYGRLKTDETLSNVVEVIVGRDRLVEWKHSVEERIRERWMYPSWSKEAMSWGLPVASTQVLELVNGYSDPMERIRLTLKAAIQIDNELEPLAMLPDDVWKSARTKEEAKERLVKFIERRKIPSEVESQIRKGDGSVEKLARRWVYGVFPDIHVPERGLEMKSSQLRDIISMLKDEVLPLWKEIKNADVKWYRRLF